MKAKIAEDTPLMKQYFTTKATYPEAILLFRVGDFYETYSDDALLVAKVLGIVLTKRSNGDKGALPMAGFPYHSIDTYLPKLVRAGYKVAVCDQLEDPKLVNKKLVKRGITELVTPGIAFNDQMLTQKENNFLAGLVYDKNKCGAAFLDVSTGTFQIAQGSNDYIATLLSTYHPKELVVPRSEKKATSELFGDNWYLSTLEEWAFVHDASAEKLRKQLKVESLKGYAIDTCPLGVCAAGALLVYLEQTHHEGLGNICSISRIDESSFVWMDRFTIRNLEIFQSASPDGVPLIDVMDFCSSPMGARKLRSWISMPIPDIDELNNRYNVVDYFVNNHEALDEVRSNIEEIGDIERIISRAATGRIAPREVLQLGRGLSRIEPLCGIGKNSGVAALQSLCDGIRDCSSVIHTIFGTLSENPAVSIGKGAVIAEGVDPELDHLRSISSGGKEYLLQMQIRECEKTGIPSLKISYNNVFGYYLEVRNIHKDKVPQDWIRKQTLVSAERYITQELKEYEEQILGAEEKIYAIESRIYRELVAKVQLAIPMIQKNARIVSTIDVLANFAHIAVENNYCRPLITDGLELDIKDGRHPVIETLMAPGEEYVPNDIYLDRESQQIIILTGPNMAGKSALLRQTALIVLMAQVGSFVPARAARIGYFDKIFTRVGASDNISRGESTFMVEMLETSMILHNLSERSLVILDEIGRGTSTYDGMSIARAIVEYIHEYGGGAKTLFATHYHELNDLEALYDRVKNYHIEVKEVRKQVIFLRKLAKGGVAHSFGIHVARLAGMPREVIESAERTLNVLESESHSKMEGDGAIQLSLFQLDDPTLSSLRETLKSADLNNMTPLQAFDLLRDMKKELGV